MFDYRTQSKSIERLENNYNFLISLILILLKENNLSGSLLAPHCSKRKEYQTASQTGVAQRKVVHALRTVVQSFT